MEKDLVLGSISKLKQLPFGSTRLEGEQGGRRFSLVLLTADKSSDMGLMKLLADWRVFANQWFSSNFTVTVEGTARWYQSHLINAPDRVLFMIDTELGYVGHVGLYRFDFADESCEIDNIVRGEKGLPGVMVPACRLMMTWGARELGIRRYQLRTTTNNTRSLALYGKLGFRETQRVPIVKIATAEGTDWVEAPEHRGPAERSNVYMHIEADDVHA